VRSARLERRIGSVLRRTALRNHRDEQTNLLLNLLALALATACAAVPVVFQFWSASMGCKRADEVNDFLFRKGLRLCPHSEHSSVKDFGGVCRSQVAFVKPAERQPGTTSSTALYLWSGARPYSNVSPCEPRGACDLEILV